MTSVEKYLKPEVIRQISRLDLRAEFVVRGFLQGLHASPLHGFSVEFSEHRRYTPGDDPADIAAATDGTFLGDSRVRQQMAACDVWAMGEVPETYGDPVSANVPTLLFSGTLDPVTGPRWGEEAASHLPDSVHVVLPGAHGVGGRCVDDISRRFLAAGATAGLDTSCAAEVTLPPFDLR